MNEPDPRARLVELAMARGVSLAALSALISRNGTYLQQFVRKGSPRRLEESDRRTLARFFDVAETELGGMEENSSVHSESRVKSPHEDWVRQDWVDVPRLALGASAGPGAFAGSGAAEDQPIGAFRFATHWLRQQGLDPAQLTAIAVTGDSMEPTLRDGDEILVDRTARALRDGVYVVRVGDALLVKRLDLGHPTRVVLISDNQVYRPFELAPDELAVIGRVVWKSGRL
ncbi:MAG: transcriptional regulator [Pseudomonadota bacterium]|nr:transcriptional regulator [Pseudomonadota bacterium]